MKHVWIFLLIFSTAQVWFIQNVFSQNLNTSDKFVYPDINKSGKSLDEFEPKNWEITDTISGDLNKDDIDDFALVLGYKDSIKIKNGYKYPRILLLVFKVGDHYELKLQHNTLIEYELEDHSGNTGGWDGDPFDSMEIVNGVLKLHFKWDVRGAVYLVQYTIRYQSNDFYLIGATSESGYRADTKTLDVNFSTRRYIFNEIDDETGFGGDYSEQHKKGILPANSLKKLIDVKEPGSWDIAGLADI